MLGIGKLLTRAVTGVIGSATGQTARVAAAAASMALGSSALAAASFPARTAMNGLVAGGAKALTTTGGASAQAAGLAAAEVASGAGQVLAVPVAGISTTAMHHFPSLRGGGGGGSDPFAGMNLPPAAMSSHK
jgi:hypothetical protein